ncbi:MAG: hypothetical protein ABIN89_25745 [Chitinophagaceae bacterium]
MKLSTSKFTESITDLSNRKYLLFLLFNLLFAATNAQKSTFNTYNLSLPEEIAYGNNQFSGLYVHEGKLFFMSESRLQEQAEGKLYVIKLSDLDHKMTDTTYVLPYQKYHLHHLNELRDKITAAKQIYEGLEAIVIEGNDIYLSVETSTASPNCYLLKGKLSDTAVIMNTNFLVTLPKPRRADGSRIQNAGFEAITMINKQVFAFFEFNYFPLKNYVYLPDLRSSIKNRKPREMPIKKLPFRITDITASGKNEFTAINLFNNDYVGDTIYRTNKNDLNNDKLIKDSTGYRNYIRLITIKFTGKDFIWETLWEFPPEYLQYNWEGIAAYKDGYFIMNDKYSPQIPNRSTLLYIKKREEVK